MRQVGKVGQRRAKGLRKAAPVVCARAGGTWYGWTGERCVGATCEAPGCGETKGLAMCHIQGRGQQGNDTPENIVVLCPLHHAILDGGDREERAKLTSEYRLIAKGGT
jgi:hypothetical protein